MRRHTPALPPAPDSPLRPGRIYVWAEGILTSLRQRWFLLLTRDALLFLALTLAVLAVDNPRALWRMWWPLPLGLAASALTLALHGASPVRWRHLLNLGIFALPLAGRVWLSLNGPIPVAGVREAQELTLILFMGAALWLVGSCHPGRALGVWLGAVALGGIGLWGIHDQDSGVYAFRGLTLFTLGWGMLVALRLGVSARWGRPEAPEVPEPRGFTVNAKYLLIDLGCLGCLGLGLAVGRLLSEHQFQGPLRVALDIHTGLKAQSELWLQSLMCGWGGTLLERLIPVMGEPARVAIPPWGGLAGALAKGGVLGIAVLVAWSMALNRQVRKTARAPYAGALGIPAALAAFMMLGLFIMGSPRPLLAALMLGGWLGLALIKPALRTRPAPAGPGAAIFGGLLMLGLAGVLALPTWGQSLTASARGSRNPFTAVQTLMRARELNPYDPAVPAGLAEAYRRQAAQGGGATEVHFIRIVRYYQDAQRLDPYETAFPLGLATFELQNDRQEEAIETVSAALERRPRARELMSWLFGTALRLNQYALADRVLGQALALNPMEGDWWWKQFVLARRIGQGPLAAQALAMALTGAPEGNALLTNAAWETLRADPTVPAPSAAEAAPPAPPHS